MKTIIPEETATRDLHQYLLGAVSPRPIAFASTIDEEGNNNLAPYSFYNCFSSNPPILVFSSNRRVSNNTTKDTLANIESSKEVVINVVSHSIVRQMTVSSVEFETGVSEFEKTGLTPIPSDLIAPARVKESPVQMECKVDRIITLGEEGGAGHLIICHVVRMHVDENVLDENNRIDPHKIDLMGRMGRAYYVRASGAAVMPIIQPVTQMVIGYDQLPEFVRKSEVLSGNNIGQLAGITEWPKAEEGKSILENLDWLEHRDSFENFEQVEQKAKSLLDEKDERTLAAILLEAGWTFFNK